MRNPIKLMKKNCNNFLWRRSCNMFVLRLSWGGGGVPQKNDLVLFFLYLFAWATSQYQKNYKPHGPHNILWAIAKWHDRNLELGVIHLVRTENFPYALNEWSPSFFRCVVSGTMSQKLNGSKLGISFAKSTMLDVWLGSEHALGIDYTGARENKESCLFHSPSLT